MATPNDTATANLRTGAPSSGRPLDDGGDPLPALVLAYARSHAALAPAVVLRRDVTTLGRDTSCDVPIAEASVSRRHARLERRAGGSVHLVDEGARNGTFVNGVRVTDAVLAEHDVVRLGDAMYRFATRNGLAHAAYRIDGTVIPSLRPFRHELRTALVGGFQMDALLDRIARVAGTPLSCVIEGESGTGKERVARALHDASGRRGALQAVNCAALPATLLESELFGHRRGAFTGATEDRPGLVRAAHGGTLFLDEIGDMPLDAQAKLLRVLQEREVVPLGATRPEKVDLRVVCATHRDLEGEVREGRFRGDLLARLREFHVRLPPLRERREDVHPLLLHVLAQHGRHDAGYTTPFALALVSHDWPYNVREFESAVRLAIALSDGAPLDAHHLPEAVRRAAEERPASRPAGAPAPTNDPRGAPSESSLRSLLAEHGGNIAAVGRLLGKERMQIHRWMKRYGIDVGAYRREP